MGKLHQIFDTASNRIALCQRAHGRPLKEDSLKMTQLCGVWMHLFLPLILLGKLRDKIGKEILKHLMTHKILPFLRAFLERLKPLTPAAYLRRF